MKGTSVAKVLIVGAGFSGAVIARQLADTGRYRISIIDQRAHIGGNSYDEVDPLSGGVYHKYGPHIFHTNNRSVFDYLSKYTDWTDYQHKVEAIVNGVGDVPLPVNLETVNSLYGVHLRDEAEVSEFLDGKRTNIVSPANAWEYLVNIYGERITELFFARYTYKMWGLDIKSMPTSIVARIPVHFNKSPFYFNDKFQFMPSNGYAALFENLLDHDAISVELGVSFDKSMENEYEHTFSSMPIDVYYNSCFGDLPYRSIKFEHRLDEDFKHRVPTVNFTDEGKYTRKTNWDLYPGCGGGSKRLVTYEIPCDYRDNNLERYYPVKTVSGEPQETYRRYRVLAKSNEKVTFVGRCGQYIYYDMHQVVASSLKAAADFVSASS